jgi:hypothetical protein
MDDASDRTGEPAWPGRVRVFLATAWRTWLTTCIGGGACGLFIGGPGSLLFFVATVPGGMYLGFFLGIPLAVGLGIWFARWARPPASGPRFVAQVEGLGASLALLVGVPINIGAVVAMGDWLRKDHSLEVARPGIVLLTLAAAGSIAMCETVGRTCGHLVAAGHLRRLRACAGPDHPDVRGNLDPPPRRRLWTWPHDPGPGQVWHHLRTPRSARAGR